MQYSYTISNNHHLVEIEGKYWLLDTGSPSSLCFEPAVSTVTINNKEYDLGPKMTSRAETEALVGARVDGFIGMDILLEVGAVTLDSENMYVTFGKNVDRTDYELVVPMDDLLVIRVNNAPFFIDTGACYDYCSDDLVKNTPVIGYDEDFNPLLGRFRTCSHEVNCHIGNCTYTAKLHEMTPVLKGMISFLGVEGIIGLSMFTENGRRNVISIDFKDRMFYAKR